MCKCARSARLPCGHVRPPVSGLSRRSARWIPGPSRARPARSRRRSRDPRRRRTAAGRAPRAGDPAADRRHAQGSPPKPRRRRAGRGAVVPWGRILGIGLVVLLLGTGVWLVVGYLAFRDSVEKANARLERITRAAPVAPVLDQQSGLLLSQPTTILVMGRDRNGLSDSLQLDPRRPRQPPRLDARHPARPQGRHPRRRLGQDQRRVRPRRSGARGRDRPQPDRRADQPRRARSTSPGSASWSTPSVASTSTTRNACRPTSTGTRTTSSAARCT